MTYDMFGTDPATSMYSHSSCNLVCMFVGMQSCIYTHIYVSLGWQLLCASVIWHEHDDYRDHNLQAIIFQVRVQRVTSNIHRLPMNAMFLQWAVTHATLPEHHTTAHHTHCHSITVVKTWPSNSRFIPCPLAG